MNLLKSKICDENLFFQILYKALKISTNMISAGVKSSIKQQEIKDLVTAF